MSSLYLDLLKHTLPELVLVITVLVVLAADALALKDLAQGTRSVLCALLGSAGLLVAAGMTLAVQSDANLLNGIFISDPLVRVVKAGIIVLGILTLILSARNSFTPHVSEFSALVVLGTIGMMLMASTEDLLMIFVSLEMTSLCLYILAAFNKTSARSAEAAMKYFLFGSMSAAFTLFGFSLLYGLSGSTRLVEIAQAVGARPLDSLTLAAIVLSLAGFGFKVAAAPFHLWAPDAYQATPIPSAAFIASGSKVASFFVLAKLLMVGLAGAAGSGGWRSVHPGWALAVTVLAALSMVVGNLGALAQSNVRRLLAYSAIAHAGYMLLGLLGDPNKGLESLVFYVLTYGATTIGAFAIVQVVEDQPAAGNIEDFAGLSRRAPLLSFCLLIFLLSLAGIPPLVGFFGKFYLFTAALSGAGQNLGLVWLVLLAVAASAVSLYYYLLVLKQAFIAPVPAGAGPIRVPFLMLLTILGLAAAVVLLGCFPGSLLAPISTAVSQLPAP